jgi:NDP-sugar pyrophosphorylase family protein
LPIANRPHIEHVFDLLVHHGIEEVILTTSYLAEAFESTRRAVADRGITLQVTHEEVALGTAGALKHAEAEIGGSTFMVFNGDVLTDVNLADVLEFHARNEAEATILLTPVEDASAFGVVPTDDEGRVTGFIEKPPREEAPTNMINAGVYVLEPSVLERIPSNREWSVERSLFPDLVADGARVFALSTTSYWMDVGTPEKYLQANMDALAGRFRAAHGAAVADDARVDETATVESSCLGTGAIVEAGATVERSVLLPKVVVSRAATVKDCILGEGVIVREKARLSGATVGDFETVE